MVIKICTLPTSASAIRTSSRFLAHPTLHFIFPLTEQHKEQTAETLILGIVFADNACNIFFKNQADYHYRTPTLESTTIIVPALQSTYDKEPDTKLSFCYLFYIYVKRDFVFKGRI
jgi:hypothetical protein